ncbi:exopolysaccharide biosynthesis polyprenyl glycosylphosphotransferase [Cellulophaga baltica]|uniref:exopolysaccharide biosynthesis polyprenyl glycosylphosphotransferase n=1 Tax=Cellulophaga TaxID=104264 RepID=UPI001C066AD7|nr:MULTISPECIES: exopolysaccharide biosynthesis polyprenyl glycosylphosphotransferase [Cellulophaga]MBU2995638.1 exopolysaccharide biosynthesis polyprenyl glycosylphosphotransferase [Cellulophaga baltica]MDO6767032.1 exopolysaccharide biosynthesis polyprenyl glycosylphosphotransferase [Cellulophaga sp. 1_MG-2023]
MKKSYFVVPLSFIFHIISINLILYLLTPETYRSGYSILYYNISWYVVTYSIDFYPTSRREGFGTNLRNFLLLFILYGLVFFTSFTFLGQHHYDSSFLVLVYLLICLVLTFFRMVFYFSRNLYRSQGYNKGVRAVVIGRDKNLKKLRRIFDTPEYGYKYMGYFDNSKSGSPTYLGNIKTSFDYIFDNNIQEVYCLASRLSKSEIQELMKIADNSLKKIKIIPDNKELFSRAMSIELYGEVPVLNLRASPLELEYANVVKRVFDIIFSSLAIVFLLSWLTPIIWILMKIDSKGPLFFKQKRHGVNRDTFECYKFRSMTKSDTSDTKMATKNDMRITKLGRILRKTSIDELPQFFNVLKGDMSVVGPRPHMQLHTEKYEKSVDKYLVRHFLKPGITGLAQIKGCRGEIVEKADIINRVRYDIFYMEKWSLQLDLSIIYYTVANAIRGEEKAY